MTPSRFSSKSLIIKNDNHDDDSHAGTIDLQSFSPFVVYGLKNRFNLVLSLPILYWRQEAEHQDAHHRSETVSGIGDISIGVRFLVINRSFGPGQKLFIGSNISVPTGKSYENNPFSLNADSVKHRHFAPGDGLISSTVNFEWWYRSENSYIFGITGQYYFPWKESDVGFLPGTSLQLNVHAIHQVPLIRGVFPYFKLFIVREGTDYWEGIKANNSGGFFTDGMIGLDFEVNEKIASVISVNVPLWKNFEGSQLDSYTFTASFRYLRHRHR